MPVHLTPLETHILQIFVDLTQKKTASGYASAGRYLVWDIDMIYCSNNSYCPGEVQRTTTSQGYVRTPVINGAIGRLSRKGLLEIAKYNGARDYHYWQLTTLGRELYGLPAYSSAL